MAQSSSRFPEEGSEPRPSPAADMKHCSGSVQVWGTVVCVSVSLTGTAFSGQQQGLGQSGGANHWPVATHWSPEEGKGFPTGVCREGNRIQEVTHTHCLLHTYGLNRRKPLKRLPLPSLDGCSADKDLVYLP